MKRFIDKGTTQKLIIDKGLKQKLIDPKLVAKALGAEDAGVKIDARQGPIALFTLRQFIMDRLLSTGGRPKMKGTNEKRDKISFFRGDREKLKAIGEYYKEAEGIKVSLSQIASALIHADLSKIDIPKRKLKAHSVSE